MSVPVVKREVLLFLSDLNANNNREWFKAHREAYQEARETMAGFCESLTKELRVHDQVLAPKLFRIYRDVRFSGDKTPYKTHFAASFAREGAQLRGGYYLQIRPGESFIACGFWKPNNEDLYRIRKELEADASVFREVVNSPPVNTSWGVLKGEGLKTAPKGFSRDHPDIDLIRRKQFIFTRPFTDREVLDPGFLRKVDGCYRDIRPFFDLMSDILTTDLNGQSLLD